MSEESKKSTYNRVAETIDGNVQSKGVKIKFAGWMSIGSQEWEESSDQLKAHAYQAAIAAGWTNKTLSEVACAIYEHINKSTVEFTLSELMLLAKTHPISLPSKKREVKVTLLSGKSLREI